MHEVKKTPLRLNSAQVHLEPWARHTQTALWAYACFLMLTFLFAGLDSMIVSGLASHLAWHGIILLINANASGTQYIQDASFAVPVNILAAIQTTTLSVLFSIQAFTCDIQACRNDSETFAVLCACLWILALSSSVLLVCSVVLWSSIKKRNTEHIATKRLMAAHTPAVYTNEMDFVSANIMKGQAPAFHDTQMTTKRSIVSGTVSLLAEDSLS